MICIFFARHSLINVILKIIRLFVGTFQFVKDVVAHSAGNIVKHSKIQRRTRETYLRHCLSFAHRAKFISQRNSAIIRNREIDYPQ